MYMSRYLKVDETVPFKKHKLWKIKHEHKIEGYYALCTSQRYLFEIVPTEELTASHQQCYLLGLSQDKAWLVEQVVELVDALYNQKSIEYEMLKQY